MKNELMKLRDRVRGCLLGVAIGDALGAPFEHLGPGETNQAIERMGGSIRDFVPYQNYPAGTWTDDTGMTLATCRALSIQPDNAYWPQDYFFNYYHPLLYSQEQGIQAGLPSLSRALASITLSPQKWHITESNILAFSGTSTSTSLILKSLSISADSIWVIHFS